MTDKVDYNEFSIAELNKKLTEVHDSLFQLRLRKSSAQLENSASIAKTKKEIARIETFLKLKQKSCKYQQSSTY